MISVDSNLSAAHLSFFPMETPRVSKIEDGSSSRSRVSESSDISLSIHGFENGDMVWGKVKSHPWWPGYIFNEAFASPSVRRTKTGDHVLVAFFGDSSYGWFDPSELVPFATNFLEKSKQTAAQSFLNAVEESVDEFSRRAALGLSCMCRNPYSFRHTREPGYYAVDVPGFERGGLYSAEQIETARKEFVPEESLSFVHRLALAPLSAEAGDVECMKKAAMLFALRKVTFEEFDDTYVEAFGVRPVRPAQDNLDVEPEKFAPRVAPLSGPLVIQEPLGSKNNKSSTFPKHTSTKKNRNKYLLKRSSENNKADDWKSIPMSSRPPPVDADKSETTLLSMPNTQTLGSVPTDRKLLPADSKQRIGGSEAKPVIGKVNKEKIKKRPHPCVDHDSKGEHVERKKRRDGIADTRSALMRTSDAIVSAPKLDLERFEWSDLLHYLSALAVDPFYGIDRNAPSIVRYVFLKFRSAVYWKSLALPLASNANREENRTHKHKEPKERKEKTSNAKKGGLIKRYSDPSNAGTTRPLSDRTEEVSAKRIKKLDQLKAIATAKKAVVSTATDPSVRQEPLLPLLPKKFTPTNLIMKFPPNSTLPSVSELKARFARFGKLAANCCRVKWEEDECRVQFKYKIDALKAYEFATGNDIFGKTQVSYNVKEVKLPIETDRLRLELQSESESSSQLVSGNVIGKVVAQPRPVGPLKSILKKPGPDTGKESQRVKFKLGGGESNLVPTVAAVNVGFCNALLLPPPADPMANPTRFVPPVSLFLPKPTLPTSQATTRLMLPQPSAFHTLENRPPGAFLPPPKAMTRPMPPRPSMPSAIHTVEDRPPATFFTPSQATTRPMPPQPSAILTLENRPPLTVLSESHLNRQVQRYGGAKKEEEIRKSKDMDVSHGMLSALKQCDCIMAGVKSMPGFVLYKIM